MLLSPYFIQKPLIYLCVVQGKSHHMQHRADPGLSQGNEWVITHKIGQNVVVTTAVLPQGHNLWQKNIDTVNHP